MDLGWFGEQGFGNVAEWTGIGVAGLAGVAGLVTSICAIAAARKANRIAESAEARKLERHEVRWFAVVDRGAQRIVLENGGLDDAADVVVMTRLPYMGETGPAEYVGYTRTEGPVAPAGRVPISFPASMAGAHGESPLAPGLVTAGQDRYDLLQADLVVTWNTTLGNMRAGSVSVHFVADNETGELIMFEQAHVRPLPRRSDA